MICNFYYIIVKNRDTTTSKMLSRLITSSIRCTQKRCYNFTLPLYQDHRFDVIKSIYQFAYQKKELSDNEIGMLKEMTVNLDKSRLKKSSDAPLSESQNSRFDSVKAIYQFTYQKKELSDDEVKMLKEMAIDLDKMITISKEITIKYKEYDFLSLKSIVKSEKALYQLRDMHAAIISMKGVDKLLCDERNFKFVDTKVGRRIMNHPLVKIKDHTEYTFNLTCYTLQYIYECGWVKFVYELTNNKKS